MVARLPLPLNEELEIANADGITVEAFPVHGKIALYLEDLSKEGLGTELGDTIGLKMRPPDPARCSTYRAARRWTMSLLGRVHGADLLLFDGTLFTDSEAVDLGVLDKTSRRMGHVPITGEGSSLHAFDGARIAKKAFIHINTTNPILERGSAAEETVKPAGWDVSYDGMTIGTLTLKGRGGQNDNNKRLERSGCTAARLHARPARSRTERDRHAPLPQSASVP